MQRHCPIRTMAVGGGLDQSMRQCKDTVQLELWQLVLVRPEHEAVQRHCPIRTMAVGVGLDLSMRQAKTLSN